MQLVHVGDNVPSQQRMPLGGGGVVDPLVTLMLSVCCRSPQTPPVVVSVTVSVPA